MSRPGLDRSADVRLAPRYDSGPAMAPGLQSDRRRMAAAREYRTRYVGTSDVTLHEVDGPTVEAYIDATIDDPPERRYALGALLGSGGMGEVRAARDLRVGRDVAVKTIHREHAEPNIVARFVREARIQARLDHPAIVPVFDLDVDEHGTPFFAM